MLHEQPTQPVKQVRTIDLVEDLQKQITELKRTILNLTTRLEAVEKSVVTTPVPKPGKTIR